MCFWSYIFSWPPTCLSLLFIWASFCLTTFSLPWCSSWNSHSDENKRLWPDFSESLNHNVTSSLKMFVSGILWHLDKSQGAQDSKETWKESDNNQIRVRTFNSGQIVQTNSAMRYWTWTTLKPKWTQQIHVEYCILKNRDTNLSSLSSDL